MTDAPRAIFRTDASVAIGGGHVRRCLVLAEALAEAGWQIGFACGPSAAAVVPALRDRGYALSDAATFDKSADAGGTARAALLVIDDYRLDAVYEARCRALAERILVIDDLGERRHDCDVLLDQTPGRRDDAYAGLVPAGSERLLGPAYALIDARFRAARRGRRPSGKVARVFVNFGTTDTANATGFALEVLAAAKLGAAIDVVLGGVAPHLPAIRRQLAALDGAATLHLDVDDMAALMGGADLAIGAGGVGALERCALGLPSAILTVADNQRDSAAALAAAGAALSWGAIGARGKDESVADLRALCADDAARAAMSAAAAALVDGYGAARARMHCFPPPRAKDGKPVSLRPARLADAAIMLAWQSAPGIRAYARNPAAPQPEEHARWLAAKLADSDCLFNIVLDGETPAGVLRFDRKTGDSVEVSILIAAARQNRGIGGAALALGRRLLPTSRIVAAIHAENRASIRLFERAGYRAAGAGEWVSAPLRPGP